MNAIEVLPLAHAMERKLTADFDARLAALKLPELKVLARACRANTRGCTVRTHWVEAIKKVWRAEIWDEVGYRYGDHRHTSRFFLGGVALHR